MKLVANECVNCRKPVGYVTPEALQIPTICVLCAFDEEVMHDWGHTVDEREKPVREVLVRYQSSICCYDHSGKLNP